MMPHGRQVLLLKVNERLRQTESVDGSHAWRFKNLRPFFHQLESWWITLCSVTVASGQHAHSHEFGTAGREWGGSSG